MVYGLYVLFPGSGLSCPRCRRDFSCRRSTRVAAPEPHEFTVRCERFVRRAETRLTLQRPSQPAPHFVTTAKRPFGGHGLRRNIVPIYVIVKRYFRNL